MNVEELTALRDAAEGKRRRNLIYVPGPLTRTARGAKRDHRCIAGQAKDSTVFGEEQQAEP